MSRTALYKLIYFAQVTGYAALVVWLCVHFKLSPPVVALSILCLFIPGRILGFFWRNLLRGLRLLNAKQYQESKRHSELFLEEIGRRPWMRHLIWLGSGSYSRDPTAMALNNLAAAEIGLAQFDLARDHLNASIHVDGSNPLPYHNMAALLSKTGRQEEALVWLERARERGLSWGLTDRLVRRSQTRFANRDGRSTDEEK
jgi:tetratricopeptide (TPR) repeat protein